MILSLIQVIPLHLTSTGEAFSAVLLIILSYTSSTLGLQLSFPFQKLNPPLQSYTIPHDYPSLTIDARVTV